MLPDQSVANAVTHLDDEVDFLLQSVQNTPNC